jgi:HEPN domain-containing protein
MSDEPEFDVEKHIAYWRDGALETWKDVEYLLKGRRIAFTLFAAHLSVEKALKAHVVKKTSKLPPTTHNLIALTNHAGLKLSQQRMNYLTELNPMNIISRYPGEIVGRIPSYEETKAIVEHTEDILGWLIKEL